MVRGALSSSLISSSEYFVSCVFAFTAIVIQPAEIKMKAVKSYCQISFSPKIIFDQKMEAMIALAVLAASKVRSRY